MLRATPGHAASTIARRDLSHHTQREGSMNYTLRNLLVAATLMMVGVFLVTSFIRGERRDLSRGKQEVQVFVAAKDIPAGTSAAELEDGGFIESKDVLREDAAPQAVGKLASIDKLVSNETIYKGETVSYTAFDKTAGLKPTAQIKGNERLLSIPIKSSNDVAGLVRPGDHVDLFASFGASSSEGQIVQSNIVARNVEIIETPESLAPKEEPTKATAPDAEGDDKLYVIKATDREAADILFGQSASDVFKISMLLRPANGDSQLDIPPIIGPLPPKLGAGQLPTLVGKGGVTQPGPNPAVN